MTNVIHLKENEEVKIKGLEGVFKVSSFNNSNVRFEQKQGKQIKKVWIKYKDLNGCVFPMYITNIYTFYDSVYEIVEPHVGGMLGINEKGQFDLLLAVKELIE